MHSQPGRTAAPVRTLEQAAAPLKAHDLTTGKTVPLVNYQADPVELKLLHMSPATRSGPPPSRCSATPTSGSVAA